MAGVAGLGGSRGQALGSDSGTDLGLFPETTGILALQTCDGTGSLRFLRCLSPPYQILFPSHSVHGQAVHFPNLSTLLPLAPEPQ